MTRETRNRLERIENRICELQCKFRFYETVEWSVVPIEQYATMQEVVNRINEIYKFLEIKRVALPAVTKLEKVAKSKP